MTTIPLGAAALALHQIARAAGGAQTRDRIARLAVLAEASPEAQDLNLGEVSEALFPRHADGVARLRDLRRTLGRLARQEGVDLAFTVDGQKRADAHDRRCWFVRTGEDVQRIERLSRDATTSPVGVLAVGARARRAVRICIDGPEDAAADDLAKRLHAALAIDREIDIEVFHSRALAGENPARVRAARLQSADLVVCLLSHAYLARHLADDLKGTGIVVPVALEELGDQVELGEFEQPFTLRGRCYAESRQRKAAFVNGLHATIAARLRTEPEDLEVDDGRWHQLVPADVDAIVDARARKTSMDRSASGRAIDDTVDVQQHLRAWADDPSARPYMVILGEYGMGKTTACQAFTRALLDRRDAGDSVARLPIYLDLRRLGDVKLLEPTLEQILEDLLSHIWQSGAAEPRATAMEVIDQVQHRRAVVVFDGLDEVLVHLPATRGQALLRELWKILPPRLLQDSEAQNSAGRVMLTCRTHFFRTLREQHAYFRGEDREIVGAAAYAALHLLPFNEHQIRAYLERRDTEAQPDALDSALDLIRSVHNLSELVQRPFNLRLIADQLSVLERRIASGGRIDTSAIYGELVASWLDRDIGKHQLQPRDKLRLMEELAATLWRAGRRSLPAAQLEDWLYEQLESVNELGRWYRLSGASVAVLAEDLRTATFIVRPGGELFEFAHTSLLEYFLARRLARALEERDAKAWAMPTPSEETFDFLEELIAAGDTAACLDGLRVLRAAYRPQASETAFAYCVRAAQRGAPTVALTGFDLTGARLRGIKMTGAATRPRLCVSACTFADADLRGARFQRVRLENCDLSGADITKGELHDSVLHNVLLHDADITGLIVRNSRADHVDVRAATAHRTQWLRCDVRGVHWPERCEGHLVAAPTHGVAPAVHADYVQAQLATYSGHDGWVLGVAYAPDGSRLASASEDASIRIWDVATGELLTEFGAHGSWVRGVAYAPDGSRLAGACQDGAVRIWDVASGEQLAHLGHKRAVSAVVYTPDSSRLASASQDGTVRIWDVDAGELVAELAGHKRGVSAVAYTPDGSRLASASQDGTVRIWDVDAGELVAELAGHERGVRGVAYAPDGTRLASASEDGSVRIWDAADSELLTLLTGHERAVLGVAYAPDGSCVASASEDATVCIWDPASGELLTRLSGHDGGVWGVAYAPDGTRLASASLDGSVRIWDATSGDLVSQLSGHHRGVSGIVYAPDGSGLVSASHDGSVRIWDVASGEQLQRLIGNDRGVSAVAYAPDCSSLATGSEDGRLRIWDLGTCERRVEFTAHDRAVLALAYAPNVSCMATAGHDGSVRIWALASQELVAHLTGHDRGVWGIAYAPDGLRLASASQDGSVRIWDVGSGKQLSQLSGHDRGVRGVAYAPDGLRLASASQDGSVRIWDVASGKQLLQLSGHDRGVHGVAYAPDGSRLASASEDGSVRVWDVATGAQIAKLVGHDRAVLGVAYAPDGSRLASASQDGSIRIWDPADDEHLAIRLFVDGEFAVESHGELTACSEEAWRWIGWLARSPSTGALTRYPAEMFGPLPAARRS